MDALILILSIAGAICMMWAYWAFDRYYDESDRKSLDQNQSNE